MLSAETGGIWGSGSLFSQDCVQAGAATIVAAPNLSS